METYKVVLIDDELLCTKSVEIDINKHFSELEIVGIFHSPKVALPAMATLQPDIVFLDVEMPWMNGFELLQQLQPLNFEVIFMTAYDEFAIQAFRANAVDYLLKPIELDLMKIAVSKAIENRKLKAQSQKIDQLIQEISTTRSGSNLCVPIRNGFEFIAMTDINYCQSDNNYCIIHLLDGTQKLISKTLKEIGSRLDENQFLRIHQSYMINIDQVKSFSREDGGVITLTSGISLPVSRSKKEEVLQRLLK